MRLMIIVCALAMLGGCATAAPNQEPQTRVIDTACAWVKFITTSPQDTYPTKQQILAHDDAYLANCPQK